VLTFLIVSSGISHSFLDSTRDGRTSEDGELERVSRRVGAASSSN